MGWMAGVRFPAWQDFTLHSVHSPALGPTQYLVQWVPRALFPAVKRPRRESDHSLPASTEVKNGGAIPPLPHMYSWHSAELIYTETASPSPSLLSWHCTFHVCVFIVLNNSTPPPPISVSRIVAESNGEVGGVPQTHDLYFSLSFWNDIRVKQRTV
jgi:hypothetical protein